MATNTPKLGLRKPAGTDLVNVLTDIDASMDILDFGVMMDGSNQVKVLGIDNRFGPGGAGANDTFVGVGRYDAGNALIYAGQGVAADANLLIQPKGAGHVTLRDSAANILLDLYPVSGVGNNSTCLVVRWKDGSGTSFANGVNVGAAGTGPGGSGRALYI